jgi:MoxR-like ATPase
MLRRFQLGSPLDDVVAVTEPAELLDAAGACRQVYVDDDLRRYITDITRSTREHETVQLGVSPRGTLALFRAAQARAALQGRGFVLPDDIKALSVPILAHRIVLSPEARLRGRDVREVIAEVVGATVVPVE